MAPEVIKKEEITAASDIWSLGKGRGRGGEGEGEGRRKEGGQKEAGRGMKGEREGGGGERKFVSSHKLHWEPSVYGS
jgi:hypothetical protein